MRTGRIGMAAALAAPFLAAHVEHSETKTPQKPVGALTPRDTDRIIRAMEKRERRNAKRLAAALGEEGNNA